MNKLYRNLTEQELNLTLYGLGKINIPVGDFEMEESVVKAVQGMTPVKLFEEVSNIIEDALEEEDIFTDADVNGKYFEDMTNAELKELCAERGIEVDKKANKATLISALRGE